MAFRWDNGHTTDMRLERVEEPKVFGFTWHSRSSSPWPTRAGAPQFLAALARDWDGQLDALKDHLDREN